jgi:hypothetical protein
MARAAIAYLSSPEEGAPAELEPPVYPDDIEAVAVVREEFGGRRGRLREALEQLAAGDASALVVASLRTVAGSLRELVALLDWLAAAGCDLVALDVNLDTGSEAGGRTIAVLREVERWEREPEPGRPPRGRPGLAAHAPELRQRIADMRGRGLSLQAIADALNSEGVPTQRGGAHWRPSSVQAALGYRRPRPAPAGAPPPPPPRHTGRHSPTPDHPRRTETRSRRRGGPRP